MALLEAQKVSIRFYLGWSARFHQFDSRLEQAMSAIDTLPDTQTLIEAILVDLGDISTKIKEAYNRLKAMKVSSIDLPGPGEIGMFRSEGRRFVGQLAATLGVEVRQDVFGSGSYHYFASSGGLVGGGNSFPHG